MENEKHFFSHCTDDQLIQNRKPDIHKARVRVRFKSGVMLQGITNYFPLASSGMCILWFRLYAFVYWLYLYCMNSVRFSFYLFHWYFCEFAEVPLGPLASFLIPEKHRLGLLVYRWSMCVFIVHTVYYYRVKLKHILHFLNATFM